MSRRGAAQPVARSYIFPFLAVLICTMGALVTLLVVIAQLSHVAGVKEAQTKRVPDRRLQDELEMLAWRASELKQSRAKTADQLADARLELSHVEDHLRRVRERLERAQAAAQQLHEAGARAGAQGAGALQQMRSRIVQAQKDLALAEIELASRKPSYCVIPYKGRHGTHRRPIYLECRAEAVVLQPEGIVFGAGDFRGPLGPGNPLAAVARAVSEHWQAGRTEAAEGDDPYPFLLVRPDGVLAFAAARAALESWGSDYGYELIEADWKVEYPQPDRRLAEVAERVASEARQRRRLAMLAAPREYAGKGKLSFAPAAFGEELTDDGGSGGPGRFGGANGLAGAARGLSGQDMRTAQANAAASGGAKPGVQRGSAPSMQRVNGGNGVNGVNGANGGNGAPGARGVNGMPGVAGAAASAEPGSSHDGESAPPGVQPLTGGVAAVGGSGPASIAQSRGQDWGLLRRPIGNVPVARHVLVECYADRLVVPPTTAGGKPAEIPLGAKTESSVDDLVSAVWSHTKAWGSAGKGMYWRPSLVIDVAPGGEKRFVEIQALLAESGLDVYRREAVAQDQRGAQRTPAR